MPKNKLLNNACGQLTPNEFQKLLHGRWKRFSSTTMISYTYDVSHLSQRDHAALQAEYGKHLIITPLNTPAQYIVQFVLTRWQQACNQHIQFQFSDHLTNNDPDIILAACSNMGEVAGFVLPSYQHTMFDGITFHQAIVCLPPNLNSSHSLHTTSHEIGHALGFGHFHDVASVRTRLEHTPQGLGCSVMPYPHYISNTHNLCHTYEVCLNSSYALLPGPLDANACTRLYEPNAEAYVYSPMARYYEALWLGFISGVTEQFVDSFASNVRFQNRPLLSHASAHALSRATMISVLSYTGHIDLNISVFLVALEYLAQLSTHRLTMDAASCLRTLVTVGSISLSLLDVYEFEAFSTKLIYLTAFLTMNQLTRSWGNAWGANSAATISNVITRMYHVFFKPSEHAHVNDTRPNDVSAESSFNHHQGGHGFFSRAYLNQSISEK